MNTYGLHPPKIILEEVSEWMYALQNRTKKLDSYADLIFEWQEEQRNLSAVQIEDWLLKEYPDLCVG